MRNRNYIGGVGKATPFLNDDELGPVLDPKATVESQTSGTSAEIAQEQLDANQGPMVGNTPQHQIEYANGMSQEEFETAASFLPIAGELIDAKNTLVDLYKGDYAGAALSAAGLLIPFVPGKILSKGGKAVAAWVKKNSGDIMSKMKGGSKVNDLVRQYNFDATQANPYRNTRADSKLKNTFENEANNTSTAIYSNPDGVDDVVISAADDNNYVAFSKTDSGSWTSKMKVSTKGKFKSMLEDATKRLPEGATLTEETNITADGLSVWSKFDGKGWKLTGKSKTVPLAVVTPSGDHPTIKFLTKEAANEKIAELKKINPNIEYKIKLGPPPPPGGVRSSVIMIELPILQKVNSGNTKAIGGVSG